MPAIATPSSAAASTAGSSETPAAPAMATPKPEAHEEAMASDTTMAFSGVVDTVAAEIEFWMPTSCCCRVSTETPALGCSWKRVLVPSRVAPVT
jgi:hypothetical protein